MMSKPDSNFDAWLTNGLQSPTTTQTDFVQQVVKQFRQQEAERLLKRIQLQKRILGWSISAVILVGVFMLLISPTGLGIYSILQDLLTGFIQLILEPTLMGVLIPVGAIILAGVVIWNAIEIVALE